MILRGCYSPRFLVLWSFSPLFRLQEKLPPWTALGERVMQGELRNRLLKFRAQTSLERQNNLNSQEKPETFQGEKCVGSTYQSLECLEHNVCTINSGAGGATLRLIAAFLSSRPGVEWKGWQRSWRVERGRTTDYLFTKTWVTAWGCHVCQADVHYPLS